VKIISASLATFLLLTVMPAEAVYSPGAMTPMVEYISPKSEEAVDLTGKESMTFRWKPTPIPGGDRSEYRFELFKGYSYERIVKETLSPRVFSLNVPADLFEAGVVYTWQVKQRDKLTNNRSMNHRWSFTVK